ncbi:MAG: hypothetical protein ABR507_00140 [Actinomycetota bacterium]|nr:hypothetical protein [Actinomycetota bacterium]
MILELLPISVALVALALLIVLKLRGRRNAGSLPPGSGGAGPHSSGDRHPRRPLVPAGSASAHATYPSGVAVMAPAVASDVRDRLRKGKGKGIGRRAQ